MASIFSSIIFRAWKLRRRRWQIEIWDQLFNFKGSHWSISNVNYNCTKGGRTRQDYNYISSWAIWTYLGKSTGGGEHPFISTHKMESELPISFSPFSLLCLCSSIFHSPFFECDEMKLLSFPSFCIWFCLNSHFTFTFYSSHLFNNTTYSIPYTDFDQIH